MKSRAASCLPAALANSYQSRIHVIIFGLLYYCSYKCGTAIASMRPVHAEHLTGLYN